MPKILSMNMKIFYPLSIILFLIIFSCNNSTQNKALHEDSLTITPKGTFGYDLHFLQQRDSNLVVLSDKSAEAQIIVSPKYQAKVFTSTAKGNDGLSFGWVNYKAFDSKPDAHMNAYGGENRLWLGPEGGKFALFFKPKSEMVFDNWKTPAAFDTEAWNIIQKENDRVSLQKAMQLINYQNTLLDILIDRTITILNKKEISENISVPLDTSVKAVGYETVNTITNKGNETWNESTGMPCLWMLDMFKPSASTAIVVPFKNTKLGDFSKAATTNYFGEISPERIKHKEDALFFKADGKSRGKLGIAPDKAKNFAGSYDGESNVLTIIHFDVDSTAKYLNQEWNTTKPVFSGDAVNAYNDGPLADGSQMGPFYEIESVSPAAFLKPGQSLSHRHIVFHFTGNEKDLNAITQKLLGVSLAEIQQQF